jgi:hypothetical protein
MQFYPVIDALYAMTQLPELVQRLLRSAVVRDGRKIGRRRACR